jgi:hypothetical protein
MLSLVLVTLLSPVAPQGSVTDLAWLSGCWEMSRNGRHIIEQWSAPEGGTLIGMSRTVGDGRTREFEFVMIREGAGGRLEYVAKPSGQAEAIFTAVKTSPNEIVFENLQHDFPTRIMYRRNEDGTLLAAVEGPQLGNTKRIEYPYAAAQCGR